MKVSEAEAVLKKIDKMNTWDNVVRHTWAFVPQTTEHAYVACIQDERKQRKSSVKIRLLFFRSPDDFKEFVVSQQVKDFGVATSPLETPHYEAIVLKDGGVEFYNYVPGFVPEVPSDDVLDFMAVLLNELHGVFIRMEENPDLPMMYLKDRALFARKEICEGKWIDGPIKLNEGTIEEKDAIPLKIDILNKAKELPVFPKEVWEVDFRMMPFMRSKEMPCRFLYMMLAVDASSANVLMRNEMKVDGEPGGLKRLWESISQQLLDAFVRLGRVPGEIHVKDGRMMRFLRPLGMQLPFKLVCHSKTKKLDKVVSSLYPVPEV